MIEIRTKMPGSMNWVIQDFNDFMVNAGGEDYSYIVRNQKEKDVIDGYSLIFGNELTIQVGEHVPQDLKNPYFFLWVVSVSEL